MIAWVWLGAFLVATQGCGKERSPERQTKFGLRVDEVFYVEKSGRVIVVGFVSSGSVKPGDSLTVRNGVSSIPVTVERLEHPDRSLSVARQGDQIGLILHGIAKEQVQAGDLVESR